MKSEEIDKDITIHYKGNMNVHIKCCGDQSSSW